LNTDFINVVMEADMILLCGEALSHCLANTVRDMANSFKDDSFIAKCVLLTNGSSNVPGFDSYGRDFIAEMTARGMQTATCESVLS
jgi:nicotinamidase-related amidase